MESRKQDVGEKVEGSINANSIESHGPLPADALQPAVCVESHTHDAIQSASLDIEVGRASVSKFDAGSPFWDSAGGGCRWSLPASPVPPRPAADGAASQGPQRRRLRMNTCMPSTLTRPTPADAVINRRHQLNTGICHDSAFMLTAGSFRKKHSLFTARVLHGAAPACVGYASPKTNLHTKLE